jgi:LuxR family maltose regulon positive regulatory protein
VTTDRAALAQSLGVLLAVYVFGFDLIRELAQRSDETFGRATLDASETRAAARVDQRALIDPLTDRELTVLRYLPGRLTNVDIASELYVSTNTVKTHLRHIYRKLEVADRDEAVARAIALGLL